MKIKNTTERDEDIRNVKFPAGKTVEVSDAGLATKMLGIAGFVEVKPKAKANVKNKA